MEKIGLEIDVQTGTVKKTVGEIRQEIKNATKDLKVMGETFGNLSPQAIEAANKLEKLKNGIKGISAEGGNMKTKLRAATQELIAMSEKFGATSAQAVIAAKKVAQLKDAIGDAKLLSDAFNPDRKFAGFSAAISGTVGGFAALQGAMGIFGGESKELEKTLLKVQSAMALSQGLNSVLDSKDAFIALGAVIKTQVVAAFATLRAAIITTGIGALVVGIGYLISKLIDSEAATKKAGEAQRLLNKAIADSSGEYTKAVSNVAQLRQEIELAKAGKLNAAKVVKHYNETIGKTTGQVKNLQQAEKELGEKAEAYVKMTLYKAAANQALEEAAKAAFEVEKLRTSDAKDLRSFNDRLGFPLLGKDKQKKLDDENKSAAINVKASNQKTLEDIADDFNKKAVDIAKKSKLNFFGDSETKKKKEAKVDPAVTEAKNLYKELEALNNKHNLTLEEQERISFLKRVAILKKGGLDITVAETASQKERAGIANTELQERLDAESKQRIDAIIESANTLIPLHRTIEVNKTQLEKDQVAARISFAKLELDQKTQILQEIGTALTALSDLVGQQTVVGKAMAIAGALINTYAGASAVIGAKDTLPSPFGTISKIAQVATILATGFKQVKAIKDVKVPGKGSGGSSFGGGSLQTSSGFSAGTGQLNPALQNNTTTLDAKSINALADQAQRIFVVESDITNSQGRIQRIKRSAIFG